MRRLDTLTGLRFLAALGVLFTHTWRHLALPDSLGLLATRGGSGVAFFFVLSGFILTYVYASRFGNGVDRSQYGEFLRARFARVYPMHVVGLLLMTVTVVALLLLYPGSRKELSLDLSGPRMVTSWFANLFLIQSYVPAQGFRNFWNAPSWSLVTEAAFYVLFPLLFIGLVRRLNTPAKAAAACLAAVVVDIVLRIVLYRLIESRYQGMQAQQLRQVVEQFFGFRIWEFLLGCALAMLSTQLEEHPRLDRVRPALFLVAALLLLVAGLTPAVTHDAFDFLSVPLFALLVFAAPAPGRLFERLLTSSLLVLLGEASFSLYITHWPLLRLLEGHDAVAGVSSPVVYWLLLVLCVAFSLVCFRYLEGPLRDLVRAKIAPRKGPKA